VSLWCGLRGYRDSAFQHRPSGRAPAGARPGRCDGCAGRDRGRSRRQPNDPRHERLPNLESNSPIRATDRFRIGSVTKSFVATVVLQLVGEGKLSLDASVERWLPGLVPNGQSITIHQLLNMTSGLFNYSEDPRVDAPYLAGNLGYVWSPKELVAIAVSHKPLFAPGKGWAYCNTCYVLLGLIVETVSGHALGVELRQRIFLPLHLRATSFDTKRRMSGRYAHGYYRDGKKLIDVSALSPSQGWAAGAMVSTADDVLTFFDALYGGRLLRPDLLRAMRTTVAAYSATFRYGLGLGQTPAPCGAMLGNHGDTAGYSTDAYGTRDGEHRFVLLDTLDAASLSKQSQGALAKVRVLAYCGGRG